MKEMESKEQSRTELEQLMAKNKEIMESKLAEQKKINVHCMSSDPLLPCKVLMCRPFLFKLQIAINN